MREWSGGGGMREGEEEGNEGGMREEVEEGE